MKGARFTGGYRGKMKYKTEQEKFWAGDFGSEYIERSRGEQRIASNTAFFTRILERTSNVRSVIELGANIGINLRAIRRLLPHVEVSAVEINDKAVKELRFIDGIEVFHQSVLDFTPARKWDLVFTKGLLIHINPEMLGQVYDLANMSSSRYVLFCEYYNPTPVEIIYRGHSDKLFKRDFAGEFLDRHNDFELLDYDFVYHRDSNFRQDDITWFLLKNRYPLRQE